MTKECAKQMAESMEKFFKIYDDYKYYKYFGFNNRIHSERGMQDFMSAQMEAMNVIMLQILNDNEEELAEQ